MAARTLYVSRKLLNADDLIAWAKAVGFPTTMLPGDLHTTIAYSREPFDWSSLTPSDGQYIAPMGERSIKVFGEAVVLAYQSPELQGRWALLKAAGASWDFPEYQPHVTFTYEPGDLDPTLVEPYRGPLIFGPEIFAEIDDTWSSKLQEKALSARPLGFGTMTDLFVGKFEAKAAGAPDSGEFEGYGSVFGVVDSHGDVVLPGAFKEGLELMKAAGRTPAMHLEHGVIERGGARGIGKWQVVEEDSQGLHVKGKIAGMHTETGRYRHAQVLDGALEGLSIGYRVINGGAEFGTKAAAVAKCARRALRNVLLEEISLVDTPSNARSLVLQVKAQGLIVDHERVASGIHALLELHDEFFSGDGAPSAADRATFRSHLEELQTAMSGAIPETGTKSAPSTIREVEAALRDAGFSIKQSRDIAAAGFHKAPLRDEAPPQANAAETKAAYDELMRVLA
jgi:HK97 family phage prohead protease